MSTTHHLWEQQHPEDAEYARVVEAKRRAIYLAARDGNDAGYIPGREFPCPGLLEPIEGTSRFLILGCSVCPFEVAVKREETTARF